MKQDTKKNIFSALLYIVLAAMIVSAVCISVISVAKKARENAEITERKKESEKQEEMTLPESDPSVPDITDEKESESESEKDTDADADADTDDGYQAGADVDEILPTNFTVPAHGYISKSYDADMPVFSITMEDYRIHDGIDIACDVGSEVYSCADGVVESVYEDPLMGNGVTVYHNGGLRSVYLNLSEKVPDELYEGANVAAGQVIGYVGESALVECAEVPHVHFTMTLDEETVDALNYIEFDESVFGAGVFEE